MDKVPGGTLVTEQIANERFNPSEQVRAFLDDRLARHRRSLEYQHELQAKLRPTREERTIRARLRQRMIDKLGVRRDIARLRDLAEERRSVLQNGALSDPMLQVCPGLSPLGPPLAPNDANSHLWMWWAYTTFFYWPWEASMWVGEDGDHIAARFDTQSGDLQKRRLRVVAHYELGGERMPVANRYYLSAPVAEVVGTAKGSAIESGLWDFGDEWAKLWLNTKQTVYVMPKPVPLPSGDISVSVSLGQVAIDSRQLIFIDRGGIDGGDIQDADMPGLIGMPPVRFFLPPDSVSIIVELEWSFDAQLEDDSFILIGHSFSSPSCVLKHPQWSLLAV